MSYFSRSVIVVSHGGHRLPSLHLSPTCFVGDPFHLGHVFIGILSKPFCLNRNLVRLFDKWNTPRILLPKLPLLRCFHQDNINNERYTQMHIQYPYMMRQQSVRACWKIVIILKFFFLVCLSFGFCCLALEKNVPFNPKWQRKTTEVYSLIDCWKLPF